MRTRSLGWMILILLITACAPAQEPSAELRATQSIVTTPEITITQTKITTHAAASPTNTPAYTSEPPAPTEYAAPTATNTPVILSHPLLTEDLLDPGSHTPYSYLSSSDEEVRYYLFLPDKFDPKMKWPLILFLHGHGAIGKKINRLFDTSLPELLESKEGFPFIVVSPQLPKGLWTSHIDPVDELIEHISPILSIDPQRLYLTGFSVGGYGAWRYALRYPQRFAALAPVASIASLAPNEPIPEDICTLNELPIWVFHGEADEVISAEHAIAAVEALESCGGNVRLTLYPTAGHQEARQNAYMDPALFAWLLENEGFLNP